MALALPFGLAFLILTPPFQVPDEEAHLRRAYEISEGRIIARKRENYTGDTLPRSLEALYDRFKTLKGHVEEKITPQDIRQAATIPLHPNDRAFVAFSNSAIHPPLPYLPQAAAILFARWLSTSVLACLYAGRLANLLTFTAVSYLAIRQAPVGKWAFAALALTPMALTLAASLSPDALTNGLCFLLVAQALAGAQVSKGIPGTRALAVMALTAAAVGLTKQMYFFLPLCYLLIPVRALGTTRRYRAGFAVVLGSTFVAVGGWALVVHSIWSPAEPKLGMDPRQQLVLMGSHPIGFLHILWNALRHSPQNVEQYLGHLGWAEVRLPTWIYVVELALLVIVCLWDFGPRSGLSLHQASIAAAVALLVSFTVLVVIHLTWDPVGSDYIFLHGRYFIPVGPLAGIAIGGLAYLLPRIRDKALAAVPGIVILCVPVVLATALVTVYERFFVDSVHDAAERHWAKGLALVGQGGANLGQARQEFEEALKIAPDHAPSHLWLGLMSRTSDPALAESHFREVLRMRPDESIALYELANRLAARGEFEEAMPLYDKALVIAGDNANVKRDRDRAQTKLEMLRQIARDFALELSAGMIEERPQTGASTGRYLKANRSAVVARSGRPALSRIQFLWRSPPPDGEAIPLDHSSEAAAALRLPFFACSVPLIDGKRVFVFAPDASPRLLADNEVSWFYQVRLADLNEAQRQREESYRREHNMQFPLAQLPQ